MQIKETIEDEKQRIYSIEQKIATAKKTQSDEMKNIDSLSQSISEIDAEWDALFKKSNAIESDISIVDKEALIRKNTVSIHKRLSQALSCMSFIIIGIPLGIRLRSRHLMVGFGASFMVILLIYYPLVVTGFVLAEDTSMPVTPALWGANGIIFLGGAFLLRKLFVR